MEVTTPFRDRPQEIAAAGFVGFYLMREFSSWPERFKHEQQAVIARATYRFLSRTRPPEPGEGSDEALAADFVRDFINDLGDLELVGVGQLEEDDKVDLENDPYVLGSDMAAYMEYEYGVVTSIEFETPGCVAVSFEGIDTFGFPPDHEVFRVVTGTRRRTLAQASRAAAALDRFVDPIDDGDATEAAYSDFENPGLRLSRMYTRGGVDFHIAAFRVVVRDDVQVLDWVFDEDASDRNIQAEFDDLCQAFYTDAPYQTLSLFDQSYVLFTTPAGR